MRAFTPAIAFENLCEQLQLLAPRLQILARTVGCTSDAISPLPTALVPGQTVGTLLLPLAEQTPAHIVAVILEELGTAYGMIFWTKSNDLVLRRKLSFEGGMA